MADAPDGHATTCCHVDAPASEEDDALVDEEELAEGTVGFGVYSEGSESLELAADEGAGKALLGADP